MDPFVTALKEWLSLVALHPGSAQDWALAGVAWGIGAWLALKMMAAITGNANEGFLADLLLAGFAGAVLVGAAAAASVWLVPLAGEAFSRRLPAGLALAALFAVAAPVFRWLQRTGYLAALFSLLAALCAAALLHLAARSIADGIQAWRDRIHREGSRRIEVNQWMD